MTELPPQNYMVQPEALSRDPNVFERTLITEQLLQVASHAERELNSSFETSTLSDQDYELVLESLKKLGDIGYISTPGYRAEYPQPSEEYLNALDTSRDTSHADMPTIIPAYTSSIEHDHKLDAYYAEDKTKGNVLKILAVLFENVTFMENIPNDFFDTIYKDVEKHIVRSDLNAFHLIKKMAEHGAVPVSPEVFKSVGVKILENYDLNLYKLLVSVFMHVRELDESSVLSPDEIHNIAVRLKESGYEQEGEKVRKYARFLRQPKG